MNLNSLWVALCTLLLSLSYSQGQTPESSAQEVVTAFSEAVCQPVDWRTIKQLYPDFRFTSVAKGRSFSIQSLTQEGAEAIAEVRTTWTVDDKPRHRNFTLKLARTEKGWTVVNSLYLAYLPQSSDENLEYALKQAWVQPEEVLWDLERYALLKRARQARRNP